MSGGFDRGLSEPFFDDLRSGASAPVLEACRAAGLDVRLRDDYLSAYLDGRAVTTLVWRRREVRCVVHRKYLRDDAFQGERRIVEGDYVRFTVTPGFAAAFAAELPALLATAAAYTKVEERSEATFLRQNAGGGPFVCVDRQSGVPGTRSFVDVVGVLEGDRPALVLVELKRDLDNRIQEVPAQVDRYLEIFSPGGSGLREDVARAYGVVATQLLALGFPAPPATSFEVGMPVLGLVVLVRYNPRSALLQRAHACADALSHSIWLWVAEREDALALPPRDRWLRMGVARGEP